MNFGDTLHHLTSEGPALCVGIDPHPSILATWGFPDTPAGLEGFIDVLMEALAEAECLIVKPQVALFERHGIQGMSVLATLLGRLRVGGVLSIGDGKRGDIGSTMAGYATAWLTPGADFEVDALTVSPYLGVGALAPALELAASFNKGIFVLAATSNPEATSVQAAVTASGQSVASEVLSGVADFVSANPQAKRSLGVVVGATVDQRALGIDLAQHTFMPILSPGFGAQGTPLARARGLFPKQRCVIAVAARSLLSGGAEGFAGTLRAASKELDA